MTDTTLDRLLAAICRARSLDLQAATTLAQLKHWLFLLGFEQEDPWALLGSLTRLREQKQIAVDDSCKIHWRGD